MASNNTILKPALNDVAADSFVLPEVKTHPYKLKKVIGLGGFSNVYVGYKRLPLRSWLRKSWEKHHRCLGEIEHADHETNKFGLAIKVCEMNKEKLKPPTTLQLFGPKKVMMAVSERDQLVQEIGIHQSLLPSRFIINLLDSFIYTKEQQCFMVMERLKVDLRTLCGSGALKDLPDSRIAILKQVLDGLCYLKDRRIVHGDIKPSNILLSTNGYVKICDFGVARRLAEGEKFVVKYASGSEEYMAPELWIPGCEYDFSVDTWAFGMVVYASLKEGKSRYSGGNVPIQRRFNSDDWKHWKIGNLNYFLMCVGTEYLSKEERDSARREMQERNKRKYPDFLIRSIKKRDAKDDEFFAKHNTLVRVVRRCLIPNPPTGPRGEVTRSDLLYRANLDELRAMDCFQNAQCELPLETSVVNAIRVYESIQASADSKPPTF